MSLSQRFTNSIKSLPLPPKQKILVTGCAGFIGSHLCERLLDLAATEDLREIDEDFVRACCEPEADGSPSDVVDASEPGPRTLIW